MTPGEIVAQGDSAIDICQRWLHKIALKPECIAHVHTL
jgi:hypothetical protein